MATKSKAEELVYHAALAQLPEPYEVIPSTIYISNARGRIQEGELDLLIFHPGLGILILEVKGGGIEYDGIKRRWYSHSGKDEWNEIKDPFEQGLNAARVLLDLVRDRVFTDGVCPLPIGNAVVFPGLVWDKRELPAHASADLIIDSRGLNDLSTIVPRIMRKFARAHRRELDEDEARQVREKVLYPTCRVMPSLRSAIEGEKRELLMMTQEQFDILDSLEETERIAIQGHAGTGKTRLAVEKAVRLYNDGKKVALLCFNRALGESLRLELIGKSNRLIVNTFHGFCEDRCKHNKIKFEIAGKGSEFWDNETPILLLEALDRQPGDFDAVIIDEGQDFKPHWWDVIWELLKEKRDGMLYIFFDPLQAIYVDEPQLPVPVLQSVMKKNCRNTRAIGELVSEVGGVKMTWPRGAVKGEPPEYVSCHDQDDMLKKMGEAVERLTGEEQVSPEQIACLSTKSKEKCGLAGVRKLGGIPLTHDLLHYEKQIRSSNLYLFKGLEADVVLLYDVVPNSQNCVRENLYVAISRACHRLVIFHDRKWKKGF